MCSINNNFWADPPWGDGNRKYRLGLSPIENERWLNRKPDKELINYKKNLLDKNYSDVIAVTDDSLDAQIYLGEVFGVTDSKYPDLIAELSLNIQDDLCLLESKNDQRLIAASICSPSYWDVKKKIGKPLKQIHQPVKSLEEKVGDRIAKFICQAPVMKPFARQNWLIHGDTKRFYLTEEKELTSHPSEWFIRSEKETLCRFHEDYSLFTINVMFQPLKYIHQFHDKKIALIKSLEFMDEDESKYFGGTKKIKSLLEYLHT